MTDLERYGRHEEGCDSEFCSVTMCGRIKGSPVHFVDVREQHLFRPQPCSCGFASALLAQGWQDIATAPIEDLVLVHDDGYVGKGMLQADGRWLDTECGRDDAFFDPPPQHWQPLPAPPDACKQVKQAAISEADNSEKFENLLVAARLQAAGARAALDIALQSQAAQRRDLLLRYDEHRHLADHGSWDLQSGHERVKAYLDALPSEPQEKS